MATYTPARLFGPAQLTATATDSSYTAPSGGAVVKQIIFNNTSASAVAVTAYIVPTGTTADPTKAVVSSLTVGPTSQVIFSADIPLTSGEKIQAIAATGAVVTTIVTGIVIS